MTTQLGGAPVGWLFPAAGLVYLVVACRYVCFTIGNMFRVFFLGLLRFRLVRFSGMKIAMGRNGKRPSCPVKRTGPRRSFLRRSDWAGTLFGYGPQDTTSLTQSPPTSNEPVIHIRVPTPSLHGRTSLALAIRVHGVRKTIHHYLYYWSIIYALFCMNHYIFPPSLLYNEPARRHDPGHTHCEVRVRREIWNGQNNSAWTSRPFRNA